MRKLSAFLKFAVLAIVVLFFFLKAEGQININFREIFNFSTKDEYASPYIYMVDRGTEEAVYEKNADSKAYPASLTKMMTTIVALEYIDDLAAAAPVDLETYRKMVAANASMAGFYGREAVTYRDLLYGTVLNSGGEAANSLAIHVGGSVETFVQMMNDKAVELGMKNTRFANPEGLHHTNQYTTAADMARLLDYALENNNFRAIFTKETFQTSSTPDHPKGVLLQSTVLASLDKANQTGFEIIGGKSGTTYEAGQCWATLGLIGDREYITIVMGAPLENISEPDYAQRADTLKLFARAR
ncbi:D-alanyl-D-alanine carboxypeptidase family protein [Sporosarcina cascadiensis]|uniref:D-alanyl-D-alanine carboxypeptidase family protein n=1 Tax=Sporosarcina cascadiensis TaxID=2660747 RepID=UPI00129AAA57|nr:serine hydrolase [Sporosarcina cascadiensis]